MDCYELSLELLRIMAEIDIVLDRKSKTSFLNEKIQLDRNIDSLEIRMFEIKNILKSKKV